MTPEMTTLIEFIIVIALGFLGAVVFYESLCQRDVLLGRALRMTRRLTERRWVVGVVYVLCVVVGMPALVVVWAMVLEIAFIVVGSADRLVSAGLIAAAIVGAARLLAYIHAPSSHELAKAVPLSLAVVLITGGQLNIDAKLSTIAAGGAGFGDISETMLVVLVGLEWTLRILTDGSNALLALARERRGIESEVGVLGTLRAVIRRPVHEAIAEAAGETPVPTHEAADEAVDLAADLRPEASGRGPSAE